MVQASTDAVAEDVVFEGGKHREHAGHRSAGGCGQIERFAERNKANAEVSEFLQRGDEVKQRTAPAVQPPDQHDIDLAPPRGIEQLLALLARFSTGANFFDLHGDGPAAVRCVVAHSAHLHRKSLLIERGDARIESCPQHFRRFA